MPQGLQHLFSGLVQGIGETTLSLEKEKRQRDDSEKAQQLQLLTTLLAMPDIQPEVRSQLFKSALQTASGGNKKLSQSVFELLGPMMQEGDGQAGGVRPSSSSAGGQGVLDLPATSSPSVPVQQQTPVQQDASAPPAAPPPSSGTSKFGSAGSGGRSVFQTPEQQTQVLADRERQVGQARADVQVEAELRLAREKLKMENEQNEKYGWRLTGFTAPDKVSGLSTAIYQNDATQQIKIGEAQVPHILTAEGLNQIAVHEAAREQARQETIRNIAAADAKDPLNPTPQEMAAAAKKYSSLVSTGMILENQKTKSEIFKNTATGQASLDRTLERDQLTMNQMMLDYNRQRDDYERQGVEIQRLVDHVNELKQKASADYNNAMVIQDHLNQQGMARGEESAEAVAQGLTWVNHDQLIKAAEAKLTAASAAAQGAAARFPGAVEAGNLYSGGKVEAGKWPYLKDTRTGFSYGPQSFPPMPERGQPSTTKEKKSSRQVIDVSDRLMKELGLEP